MKITLLAALFVVAGEVAVGQDNYRHAPERVRQSFSSNFPDARDARWTHSGNQWSARFDDRSDQDRGEMVAHFDEHGRYIDSHIPYAETDVPQPVYESARRRYHRGHMQVTMIDHPSRPDVFQVRGRVDGRRRTSYYDEHGRERDYRDRH